MEANKHKQDIAREFVNREVYANANEMVEYILQYGDPRAPFDTTNIDNLYIFPEYDGSFADFDGGTEEARCQEIERLETLRNDVLIEEGDQMAELIDNEIKEIEDLEEEEQEILEWWIVSPFLANKLYEYGGLFC